MATGDPVRDRRPGVRLRARSADPWLVAIVVVFALRLVLAAVLLTTQLVERNGLYWANDDQTQYYGFARALLDGDVAEIYTFMGYGVLLAPLAARTDFVLDMLPAVAIVQVPLAAAGGLLLYRAGVRLADRRVALAATALWLSTPLWLGAIWTPSYSEPFSVSTLWLGLQVSVDYASALLAICVLVAAAGARTDGSVGRGVLVGVLAGLAFLTKPSNVVVVGAALAALGVWGRWRAAAASAAAAAVVFAPQLALNWTLNRNPLDFSYSDAWPFGDERALAAAEYIPRTWGKLIVSNYTGPVIVAAAAAALVLAWRRVPALRWLVVAQVVAFALFFSPLYYSISGFLVRFMTPALPALCLAAAAALFARRGGGAAERTTPPGRLALGAGAVALGGSVALTAFVLVAPVRPVLPVLDALDPQVEQRDGAVMLTWSRPSASSRLGFQVRRTAVGASRPPLVRGAGGTLDFTDRPGPGIWRYRVLVSPGSHPEGWPPRVPLATSRAVVVRVPER